MRVSSQVQPIATPLSRPLSAAGEGGGFASIVNNGVLADYVTFTRASTATYFDSAGVMQTASVNQPRVDYDPATLELRGLLIEEQRTNLLLRSQEFDNPSWTKTLTTVTANAAVAPDGTLTADRAVISGMPSKSYITQSGPNQSGTLSIYAKAGSARYVIVIRGIYASKDYAIFDLQDGVVTQQPTFSGTTAVIQNCGGGWYRCILNSAQSATDITGFTLSGSPTGLATGTSGDVYLWGAQFEAGAFATSYIPTTSAAVTRSVDTVSPTPLSSLGWNSSAGSLFIETQLVGRPSVGTNRLFIIRNGAAGANILFAYNNSSDKSQVSSFDGSTPSIASGPSLVSAVGRRAVAFDSNGKVGVGPYGVSASAYNGAFAPATHFVMEGAWNGWIRRLRYYPRRLPDAQLQALTA